MTTAVAERPRHLVHAYLGGRCQDCSRCARCGGRWNETARDEFGGEDPHCITCGARPLVDGASLGDPTAREPGKLRRREPSHGRQRL
ncbi:MAG: hypothetical protein AB7G21_09775 [Dehalococcoidia bacterium]